MNDKKVNKKKNTSETGQDERFAGIKFAGTFREYQQNVIKNCEKHLADGKVHIVASPGSGKTILGLELVRKLGKPALILSPTTAIREQWKDRFGEMFLPEGADVNKFVSCTLLKPSLLTSITYQGLYSACCKVSEAEQAQKMRNKKQQTPADEDEGEAGDDIVSDAPENFSGVDIYKIIEENNIGTLCLDEAHHLRAEWQKALIEFVQRVKQKVTVIALTATPPYDSKKSEWEKYITICGPIDEEIFVPALVRVNTLCPHQDYIHYGFPSEEELKKIENYKKTVEETLNEVLTGGKFLEIITNSEFYKDPEEFEDELNDRPEIVSAILSFFEQVKLKPSKAFTKILERDIKPSEWELGTATLLLQGMMTDDVLFSVEDMDFVKHYLSQRGLVEKNKVGLETNGELEALLLSSTGKIASIGKIVTEEAKRMGDKIRLLVLTDYIRANSNVLGSDKEINELGAVPIFELIRRQNLGLKIAVLSGKIVIAPNESIEGIGIIAKEDAVRFKAVPIGEVGYSELKFEGGNNFLKIGVITKAFNKGILNAIVGTKSLLGEGWDSPVINTLILASCVGSFMLSNQMRGRAIRIDKFVPDKVSNIWHLATVLPESGEDGKASANTSASPSADYATLERRFHGFMGLSYFSDVIESGLTRANTLSAPYDQKNVNEANEKSFAIAADREQVASRWKAALANAKDEVIIQNEIPKPKKGFIPSLILKPSHFSTVKKMTSAVAKSFKELGTIGKKAKPVIEKDYKGKQINVGMAKCSQHEKSLFHDALGQAFGPIENPKYILVKMRKGKPDPRAAFAVPESFAGKKESAELFCERIGKRFKGFELFFTRSESGKQLLSQVQKKAYVNKINNAFGAKMKLRD